MVVCEVVSTGGVERVWVGGVVVVVLVGVVLPVGVVVLPVGVGVLPVGVVVLPVGVVVLPVGVVVLPVGGVVELPGGELVVVAVGSEGWIDVTYIGGSNEGNGFTH